jgi:uracil-DNA glycosylase
MRRGKTRTLAAIIVDAPKSLAGGAAVKARRAALTEPHVAPLAAFVNQLRGQAPNGDGVPDFDPLDGGVKAECLFLLEAPGGKAVGSGFVSRNNPDETAKNFFQLNEEAGLPRGRTVIWNVVPWYVGSGTKIRAVNGTDIKASEPHLMELLRLLPALRAVVLIGRKAQRTKPLFERLAPHCAIFQCPHPSPLSLNGRPEQRMEILRCLRAVVAHLGVAANSALVTDTCAPALRASYSAPQRGR